MNSHLDNFGAGNIGLGFGYGVYNGTGSAYSLTKSVNRQIINAAPAPDPYLTGNRMPVCIIGQKNWVSGARHVLKLVDGTLGNLPLRPDNSKGGFTVGSENPVYIYGDYNSNPGDLIWNTPAGADAAGMAAAGIVADAVTVTVQRLARSKQLLQRLAHQPLHWRTIRSGSTFLPQRVPLRRVIIASRSPPART